MKQRKKQPGATRQAILLAAGAQFAKFGFTGSGLGSIVAAAGLTKGALFHHFPDKRSLAAAWIADCLEPQIAGLWLDPLAATESLLDIKSLCRARVSAYTAGDATSTLAALATELGNSDATLAAALGTIYQSWHATATDAFARARDSGTVYRGVKPANEAEMLVALLTGIAVCAAVAGDAPRQHALQSLDDYLDTLKPA